MDSQGNSDPITSSGTQADQVQDDHLGVFLYSESLEEQPKPIRRATKKKKRKHRYRSSWEEIDDFKEWLQPSTKPKYLAFCSLCNAYLKGASGRNDITKHSKTEIHLKNSGKPTDCEPSTSKKRIANEDSPQNSEFAFCGVENVNEECTPTDKERAKRRNQPFMYNPSWEKVDAFRQWIQPSDKPDYVAYCSVCKSYLKGSSGRNDITKHSLTELHLNNVKSTSTSETKFTREPELQKKYAKFMVTSRDESQIFGDYVASAIRDLTDERSKKRLKLMIQRNIIQVQETDGESVENVPQKTYYSNIYTPVTSMSTGVPIQVASTAVNAMSIPPPASGILPVQVESPQGQYQYNLIC